MASIAISASLQRACSSHHVTKKQQPHTRPARCVGSKQVTHVVATLNVEDQNNTDDKSKHGLETKFPDPKFIDKRWKKGTWDLNMFVKDGKMDWRGLIVAGK